MLAKAIGRFEPFAMRWRLCLAGLVVLSVFAGANRSWPWLSGVSNTPAADDESIDGVLQAAATRALDRREGVIIVMDPQTGRIRAVVNPSVAFAASYAPGSTIKPFTTLAAMRTGVIDHNSRTVCQERYTNRDF